MGEFIEHHMPVDDQMFGWILGKGGKTINDIKRSAGLVYARLDRDTSRLELCGTRQVVDDAVAMFETHSMYFGVFREMDDEMGRIHNELAELGDYDYYDSRYDWETTYDSYSGGGGSKGKKGESDDKGKGKSKGKAQNSWGNSWEYEDSGNDWKNDWKGKDYEWKNKDYDKSKKETAPAEDGKKKETGK